MVLEVIGICLMWYEPVVEMCVPGSVPCAKIVVYLRPEKNQQTGYAKLNVWNWETTCWRALPLPGSTCDLHLYRHDRLLVRGDSRLDFCEATWMDFLRWTATVTSTGDGLFGAAC
jgi:hypothetical protein